MNILTALNPFKRSIFTNVLLITLVTHTNFLSTYTYANQSNSFPLILANSSKEVDYKNFLHFSKKFHSFSQEYLNKQELYTKKLSLQIKSAQDLYFQGKVFLAKKSFSNIIKQKWDQDWTEKQSQWIYFSFLRLSQMEENIKDKKSLIKEAIAFSSLRKPDPKIFNPPFINLYNKLHKETKWSYITQYLKLQSYEKILINGQVFNITPNIKIPIDSSQYFRMSLLSNRNQIKSHTLSYELFIKKEFTNNALVTGKCEKFKNHSQYKYSIFFTKDCIIKTQVKKEKINLFPKKNLNPLQTKKKKTHTTEKRNWILITLGIVVALVVGAKIINPPSYKDGFNK